MAKIISSLPGSAGVLSKTSQLINDGESGVSTYVELNDLSTVATTGDYNNLINIPIDFTPKVHTHNISDISGTKSEFNTSLIDGNFLFVGDVSNTPDATTTSKGVIKLAGDLAGTADAPTVPGLANKVDKVTGKSLISDTEITRLSTVTNQDISGKEDISNKISAVTGVSTLKYISEKALVDYVDSRLPTNYTKVVYVNTVSPGTATIFDLNNPPAVHNASLQNDVNNLYIGTDASTWVYNTSPAGYVTKIVTATTSNFNLAGTSTDSGNNKTGAIERTGTVGGAPATAANHFVVKSQLDLKADDTNVLHKTGPEDVSGIKTFFNGMFGMRNVANTFTSFFTNTNTASRTYTLPDKNGTVALLSDVVSITEYPKTASFSVSNAENLGLYVINSASAITITLPSGLATGNMWEFLNIGTGIITFLASGSTIISPDNRLKIRTQYSSCRVIARASNQLSLGGDLAL